MSSKRKSSKRAQLMPTPVQKAKQKLPPDLLACILDAPDDDAPRLVLADALLAADEKDPRGELITIQCALAAEDRAVAASKPPSMTKTKRKALERAANLLLRKHRKKWQAEIGLEKYECTFRRGFIEQVVLNDEALGPVLSESAWKQSPIRDLDIDGRAAFDELLDHPLVERLTALRVGKGEVAAADLKRLASSSPKLASFTTAVATWGPAEIALLETWPSLDTLALMVMRIEPELVAAIAKSSFAKRLVHLDLRCDDFNGKNEVAHVVASAKTSWPALKTLMLVQFKIDDVGAEALANATGLAKLTRLNLALNTITNRGAKAIAKSSALTSLQVLDLSFNRAIGSAAAGVFANPKNLPALEQLDMRYIRGLSKPCKAKLAARFGKRFDH